jgi:multicomponent K+:H+ antiporter subunit G
MSAPPPIWLEAIVAALMIASGLLSLIAALGIVRLRDFFQRLHPPALANTLAAWCACFASIAYLSTAEGRPLLYPVVLNVLLAITAPITTALLARAALFRARQAELMASRPRDREP